MSAPPNDGMMANSLASSGGAEAPRFVQVLTRYGATPDVALATLQTAGLLRAQMLKGHRRDWKEWAAMLDIHFGAECGPWCSGEADQVDIADQLRTSGEREVMSLHTHPCNASFSSRDAEVLLANPTIRALVVIGADGTLYVLSRDLTSGMNYAQVRYQVESMHKSQVQALATAYRALRRAGYLTRAAAWRAHSQETWERIGTTLGLLYDRVEAAPPAVRSPQ